MNTQTQTQTTLTGNTCRAEILVIASIQTKLLTISFADAKPSKAACSKCPHVSICSMVRPEILLTPKPPVVTKIQIQTHTQAQTQLIAQSHTAPLDTSKMPTVPVKAFTGMVIGSLPIVQSTATTLTVVTGKGVQLVFNKKTGEQTNSAKPQFANRIEPTTLSL